MGKQNHFFDSSKCLKNPPTQNRVDYIHIILFTIVIFDRYGLVRTFTCKNKLFLYA